MTLADTPLTDAEIAGYQGSPNFIQAPYGYAFNNLTVARLLATITALKKQLETAERERGELVETLGFGEPDQLPDGSLLSHDAYENLDSAIYDLERLKADPVCIKTCKHVAGQLRKARELLKPAKERG